MKKENDIHIFIYGTLLTGERNAYWAGNAKRTKAYAIGRIYDTGFGFPAFTESTVGRIAGELLTANEEQLRMMDRLEGYPNLYRREKIKAQTVDGPVEAWVYIMNNLPSGAKHIRSGNWKKYRKEIGR